MIHDARLMGLIATLKLDDLAVHSSTALVDPAASP